MRVSFKIELIFMFVGLLFLAGCNLPTNQGGPREVKLKCRWQR